MTGETTPEDDAPPGLRRSISLPQAVALYAGAVVGAGVLILPGVGAGSAGPASLVAWSVDGLLGVPVALTFAALASRLPDAGGVSVYASRAFGDAAGTIVGWFYFFAAAVAQALVALTGAHYAAAALHWGRAETFGTAGLTLALAVAANLRGLRLSGRLQLALALAVGATLLAATLAAIPDMDPGRLQPFAPHGWHAVGTTAVTLFFAFFGWEAIAHLSAEFRDPARDVPRATVISVALVTVTYLGVAFAVVTTGAYGGAALDRVAVAHVLGSALGHRAVSVAAAVALVITLGTVNAFVAATSRLGYALARDGSFPKPLGRLTYEGVPATSILIVGAIAGAGLLLGYPLGWGAEDYLVVPNSLVILVYAAGMFAGVRLLSGGARLRAGAAALVCLALLPFAGVSLAMPAGVAAAALLYRRARFAYTPGSMPFASARHAQRLQTLRTPWKLAYALRRRAMLAALLAAAPRRTSGPPLEHLGSDYGGWTVPVGVIDASWRCLCAGAGIDVSFDLTLAERTGASVITVDPTDEAREHVARVDGEGRLEFVQAALWDADGELDMYVAADPGHRSLSSDDLQRTGRSVRVPARAPASFGPVELVKLDIEGAEYPVLPVLGPEVRVLCVEMHPTRGLASAVRAFRALRHAGFELAARRGADFTFVRQLGR